MTTKENTNKTLSVGGNPRDFFGELGGSGEAIAISRLLQLFCNSPDD